MVVLVIIFLFKFFTLPIFAQEASITPSVTPTSIITPSVTAIPTPATILSISSIPNTATQNQNFTLVASLSGASANTSYYLKAFGGPSDNYSVCVQNGANCINGGNGAWSSMPQVTTDASGNFSQSLTVQSKDVGLNNIYLKIEKTDGSNALLSSSKSIQINSAPTNPPANTSTPSPTVTLSASATSTPTKVPTTIPSKIPTETPEPTLNIPTPEPLSAADSVLSDTDNSTSPTEVPSPTPVNGTASGKSKNILPFIFIAAGGLLLLVPIIITKIPS